MTHEGLKTLFETDLTIERQERVADLIGFPGAMLARPCARDLPTEKQFELVAATILFARKPAETPK